jgi:hypothetical protein
MGEPASLPDLVVAVGRFAATGRSPAAASAVVAAISPE